MKKQLCVLAWAAAGLWPCAQAQDPARALGELLRQIKPGTQSAPATTRLPAANELLQLLSESLERVDQPKEIEIGRQLAAVLLGSKLLHRDLALQTYVNRLGRWISLQSSRPQLPWTFAVLDDPGFNAFAAPGGYVFVTQGLVQRVDEAELAGILAQEITHVTARHHLQALAAKARSGMLTRLLAAQVRPNNAAAATISAQVLALGRDLYASGLGQADEFEADREGVTLAARAGFDPYGLPSVLQQLRAAAPDNPLFTLTLGTHPPPQQRLDQLEAAMGSRLDALSGQASVAIAQRLRMH
ncbi:M48 family metalloprotease [Ramlibacter sp.]|uniref:M48 family metalloprotease n=1 Tax=Ramlibacter sp. TaxID=1917967 RepID=UPI0026177356|nr:M48 family metalloprotease [Ramlibacter sp.]MDB5955827.1 Peptidase [Ramlibacter sp.]